MASRSSYAFRVMLILIFFLLAGCAGQATPTNTPAPVPSGTPTPSMAAATLPSQPAYPLGLIDDVQYVRWQQYERAMAQAFFPPESGQHYAICEWDVLGQAGEQRYVWIICSEAEGNTVTTSPAVLYIDDQGIVYAIERTQTSPLYEEDVRRMFPEAVQQRILGNQIAYRSLSDHLLFRKRHPEVPPLVVVLRAEAGIPLQLPENLHLLEEDGTVTP